MNETGNKKSLLTFGITFILFFTFIVTALAADRFWVAPEAGLTSSSANWSTSSGGIGGASVPGIYDTANFDSGGVNDATVDADMTVLDFIIAVGYTGIVSINDGVILTIGSATVLPSLVTITQTGEQIPTTLTNTTDVNLGGAFLLTATEGDATTTAIRFKQKGSLATSSITNIDFSFKDAVAGVCSTTTPAGTTAFGTAGNFDENNFATTTGSLPLTADTPVCLYINYDLPTVYTLPMLGQSIDFEIVNPSVDIIVDGGEVTTTAKTNVRGRTMIVNATNPEAGPNACTNDEITDVLSLHMRLPAKNPTVYYLQNCIVWKMEAGGTPFRLTNPNLKVHDLTFRDLTGANSGGTIKMSITISNVDLDAPDSFINVTRTFSTTETVKAWSGGW